MSKYFLVPDIHGELDMAIGLLQQEGILDENYDRVSDELTDDLIVVQMGDFLNCVGSSVVDDSRCLDNEYLFDVLLVGNHEHPYFGGPAFAGFHHDHVIMHRLKLLDAKGRYKVALNCDGILVTHAGVTTDLFKAMQGEGVKLANFADALNGLWNTNKTAHPFSSISWNRGGPYKQGGILWADWQEYKASQLKQVVGHTVGEFFRVQYEGKQRNFESKPENYKFNKDKTWEAICVDLGAGKHSASILGVWIEDGNVRLVEYRKE